MKSQNLTKIEEQAQEEEEQDGDETVQESQDQSQDQEIINLDGEAEEGAHFQNKFY